MNLILNSFKKSFKLIKKHKSLFVVLLLLQLIFFSVFLSIQFSYWMRIMEGSLEVIDYLSAQNLDEASIEDSMLMNADILGEDPLLVYRNAKSIVTNFIILSLLSIICFIIFEGLLWAITDNLVNKKKLKQFFIYLGKFSLLTIIYFVILYIILFLNLKTLYVDEAAVPTILTYIVILIMFLLVLFMFASYALIGKYKMWEAVKMTFLGIKNNLGRVLLSFLIILVVIGVFSYLIILIQELHFILMFIVVIGFIFSFVFCRMFLYLVMNELKA